MHSSNRPINRVVYGTPVFYERCLKRYDFEKCVCNTVAGATCYGVEMVIKPRLQQIGQCTQLPLHHQQPCQDRTKPRPRNSPGPSASSSKGQRIKSVLTASAMVWPPGLLYCHSTHRYAHRSTMGVMEYVSIILEFYTANDLIRLSVVYFSVFVVQVSTEEWEHTSVK